MTDEQTFPNEQAALLAELQHRVRNTLSAMRIMVRRSAETSESLEEYVMHLEGRLDAMARVQGAFVRHPTGGFDLESMVASELVVLLAREGERFTLDGPVIRLHPRAAETFGLVLHELAVNALKFGALSNAAGRIAVTWRIDERARERVLLFDWTETGGPPIREEPAHRGFGWTVLVDMLPHNLKGQTTLRFAPEGLHCRIALPVTERVLTVA